MKFTLKKGLLLGSATAATQIEGGDENNNWARFAAEGKIKPEEIGAILDSGNRTAAGPTVPPGGLYMTHLWYDDGVDKFECPCAE